MDEISVCIPAHNEESSLARTLHSIINQQNVPKLEIIVCANGCTDKTEGIARDYERAFSHVHLISTGVPSKANAWNLLIERAQNDFVAFADADVVVRQGAFSYLTETLKANEQLALVGAAGIPLKIGQPLLERYFLRYLIPDEVGQSFVRGGLYAVEKRRLKKELSKREFTKMPEIIADDRFLQLVCSPKVWAIDRRAQFYFRSPTLADAPSVFARYKKSDKQLNLLFGFDLPQLDPEKITLRLAYKKLKRLIKIENPVTKIDDALGFIFRKYFEYQVRKASDSNTRWPVARSTKIPIPYSIE